MNVRTSHSMNVILLLILATTLIVVIPTSVRGQVSSPETSDLIDIPDRLPPDDSERPHASTIQVPDSLDEDPQASQLSDWVRWIVLKNIPTSHEDNKKWGLQKQVYDGFRFRRENWKVETYRKYKTVKHGTWSRYYIELDDPQKNLDVRIDRLQPVSDERFVLEATIQTPLHAFGRISQWQRDVQLISVSTNADASVRLWVRADVGMKTNPLVFPPEIHFSPKVTDAKIELLEFEVHRISQVGGPLAEQLGKSIRGQVEDKLDEYSDKLVVKLNAQLEKQKDKLKLSFRDQIESTIKSLTTP